MAADQPIGSLGNRVEHRLQVRRRAGDDFENVGRGGLPLQRLPGLVEEPRVLNRYNGLISEGLQKQRDLQDAAETAQARQVP